MIVALLLAAAPAAGTPRAFIERLYESYRQADFSPFKHPEQVFAPGLLAAIAEDEKLAKGEVGYLDGDPICQCQDAAGLKATVTRVTPVRAGKATVTVRIVLAGETPRPAQFSLLRTQAGWRIADISSAEEPSLLGALEATGRQHTNDSHAE
jgi:hypothetical protein